MPTLRAALYATAASLILAGMPAVDGGRLMPTVDPELIRRYPVRGGAVAPKRTPWWPVPALPRHRAEVLASRKAAASSASWWGAVSVSSEAA